MGCIADLLKEIPSAARYKSELEAMEKENAQLKREVSQLKTENKIFKSQVVDLRQEIQRRDDIIQKEKSHNNPLSEIEVKILLYLTSNNAKTAKQIAEEIGRGETIITFHLVEMSKKGIVAAYAGDHWCLEHEGRKYLIDNKLIS